MASTAQGLGRGPVPIAPEIEPMPSAFVHASSSSSLESDDGGTDKAKVGHDEASTKECG